MKGNFVRSIIIIIAALLYHGVGSCQAFELSDIAVNDGAKAIELPFAGGLRAPQFNIIDINLDGINDVLVFDREGNVLIPLIRNANGKLTFEPSYRSVFPNVRNWILARDYNGDGIKDLFCAPITVGIPGIAVYKGVITGAKLTYELITFDNFDFDILSYPLGSAASQIYASPADIPDIRDADGDGDLDILAFEPSGGTIFLYQNMSVERGVELDKFEFTIGEQCYGAMIESGVSQAVTLSPDAGTCASLLLDNGEFVSDTRHAGSTVLSYDVTGDDLPELILGDISYSGLVMLTNGGTTAQAWMTDQELEFPKAADEAVNIELFVAATIEDIDNDGAVELITAPNSRSSAQGHNHVWMYEIGTDANGANTYELKNKNHLVDEMIYTGTMSAPMFLDYNNDGLTDLLIGTSGRSPDGISIDPRMILYENVGTKTVPSFALANNDYLNMASFATTSRHFAPAIGDIDGDSDLDMVIGDETGRLYVVYNASSSPDRLSFGVPQYDPWGIRVSAWAKPAIVDYNDDGLGDLIIGEQNFNSQDGVLGSLNYYENQGSPRNAQFDSDVTRAPNNPILGGVYTKLPGFINNYSAPSIVDLGDRLILATGSDNGNIYLYDSIRNEPGSQYELVSSNLGEMREGFVSTPAMADLNGDNILELAIGSRRGGVAIYNTDIAIDFSSPTNEIIVNSDQIKISPNPTLDFIQVELLDISCEGCRAELLSVDGRLLSNQTISGSTFQLDMTTLASGIYSLLIKGEKVSYSQKVVKIGL